MQPTRDTMYSRTFRDTIRPTKLPTSNDSSQVPTLNYAHL